MDLENALDIGGFGYPTMAVINLKKMKYSLLRGSFSKDGINEYLRYDILLVFFMYYIALITEICHMDEVTQLL